MDNSKRLVLFFVLSFVLMMATQSLMEAMGWLPRRGQRPAAAEGEAAAEAPAATDGLVRAFAGDPGSPPAFAPLPANEPPPAIAGPEVPAARADRVDVVPEHELVLGEADPKAPHDSGYHMRVELTQRGGGVRRVLLAYHEEQEDGRRVPGQRLALIDVDPADYAEDLPPPLGIDLAVPRGQGQPDEIVHTGVEPWEVVRDEQGQFVRRLAADPSNGLREGQEIVFRKRLPALGLTITKAIGLRRGIDGLELRLEFESSAPHHLAYKLQGPYSLPIEGEWYTSTFREVFFGKLRDGQTEIETKTADEVADREAKGDPVRATSLPLKYAGVENQYFASFFEPVPLPARPDERRDEKTVAIVTRPAAEKRKSDVSVVLDTRPIDLAPGQGVVHGYRVFAGPKSDAALAAFGAEGLSSYRKGWQIPLIGPAATFLARTIISPLLDQIYNVTRAAGRLVGAPAGNYGIAIILLTVVVRLLMFPLSRKQAVSAKRMQDLQPQLMALREKYKDDKEKIGRETLALYQRNGVNPFGGCLLVLLQMPIFLGLWQTLNNSVALRHAPFLWIRDLAAPDMLFPFGMDVPFLGRYFNLLPCLVVVLMMIQTKLFSPPATTDEQKQQQMIMKWMLVFMAVMFYRVPAGLSLYFITSSLWSIGERLLLTSHTKSLPPPPAADVDKGGAPSKPGDGPKPGNGKPGGWRDRLRERIEQVMEEAAHDKTVRNADRERGPAPRPGDPSKRRPRRPRGRGR
jgi:YidC/Oxa1 family membrane protein insertase